MHPDCNPAHPPATPVQDLAWTLMVHRRWLATRALPALVALARPLLRLAFALNALLINALLLGELRLNETAAAAAAAAAPSAAHSPSLGVRLLAASLCVLQLAASVILLVGHLVEHLPPTLERRWTDVRRRAAHLAAVAPNPGGGGLLGESGLLGALAACLPRPTSNADAPTRRAEGGCGGGCGKSAALGRLLTTPAPVQRWHATAARVVAHLCTGRVRARDGYPAGRAWGLALQACSGAPPYALFL